MNAPASRPRARSVWFDLRFLAGVVIVAVSVTGVWLVVTAARQTTPVLVAARTLVVGETVGSGDVRVVEVALGQLDGRYAAQAVTPGAVAMRTVPAGELVPVDALGPADAARTTTVVVPSATAIATSVGAGTAVEVWVAPRLGTSSYDTPRILIADATVVEVVADDALVSAGRTSVELVVPRADVAALLAALADDALLSVVPGASR